MVEIHGAVEGKSQSRSTHASMITTNETGPDVGRCLFTLFESGQAGVQRIDIWNGNATQTLWCSPVADGHASFDASCWTPFSVTAPLCHQAAQWLQLEWRLQAGIDAAGLPVTLRPVRTVDDDQRRGQSIGLQLPGSNSLAEIKGIEQWWLMVDQDQVIMGLFDPLQQGAAFADTLDGDLQFEEELAQMVERGRIAFEDQDPAVGIRAV